MLRGGCRTVRAHSAGEGFGADSHLGLKSAVECRDERVDGRCCGRVRDAYSEVIDAFCEVVLVVPVRHDHLGRSGSRGRGRRARTAVVDNSGDTREERLQVGL